MRASTVLFARATHIDVCLAGAARSIEMARLIAHGAITLKPTRVFRRHVESAVTQLIDALDTLDGDADSEPALGSLGGTAECIGGSQVRWAEGSGDERELDASE